MLRKTLFVLIFTVLSACGGGESGDGVDRTEIVPLDEARMTNFLAVLPEILDFADGYNARLTPREREDPGANVQYFRALRDSTKIRAASESRGFRSVDELLLIYKNVLLEYISVKQDLTNDAALSSLRLRIDEARSNANAKLQSGTAGPQEIRELRKQLDDLARDQIRYENILLVKKYESDLDRISQNR